MLWDFYRNAVTQPDQPDQPRQRFAVAVAVAVAFAVAFAFALSHLFVVGGVEIEGTCGFRNQHNTLLDSLFDNARQLRKSVALSAVPNYFLKPLQQRQDHS